MSKIKLKNSICVTCLSSDRQLHPVGDILQCLPALCSDVKLEQDENICWECRAILTNVARFRARAHQARTLLATLAQKFRKRPTIKTLSRLSSTKAVTVSNSPSILEHSDLIADYDTNRVFVKPEDDLETGDEVQGTDEAGVKETTVFDSELCMDVKTEDCDDQAVFDGDGESDEEYKQTRRGTNENKYEDVCKETTLTLEQVASIRKRRKNCNTYITSQFKCEKCIEVFTSEASLSEHNLSVHDCPGDFVCMFCERRLLSQQALESHSATHYRGYSCVRCDFASARASRVAAHHARQHAARPTRCRLCGEHCESFYAYKAHKRERHSRVFPCKLCDVKCSYPWTLKKHILKVHHDVPPRECPVCRKQYRGEDNLKIHIKRNHSQEEDETAFCSECGLQFRNATLYKRHLRTRRHVPDDQLKYKCLQCGKRFIAPVNLRRHTQAVHTERADYACHVCSKAYTSNIALRRHVRDSHSDTPKPKDKVCEICARAFTTSHVLANHLRTHTGERPYACDLCPMRFAQRVTLRTHVRGVHDKVKKK